MNEKVVCTKEFANGCYIITPGVTRIEAARQVFNEDWKTAIAHKQRSIQPGEQGTLIDNVTNFYGNWAYVQFDGVDFRVYVAWRDLRFVS